MHEGCIPTASAAACSLLPRMRAGGQDNQAAPSAAAYMNKCAAPPGPEPLRNTRSAARPMQAWTAIQGAVRVMWGGQMPWTRAGKHSLSTSQLHAARRALVS